MRNFFRLAQGVQVDAIMNELIRQPELWNQHTWRTTYENTPHGQVDDIWLRYSDPERTQDPGDTSQVQNDTGAVWYPGVRALPAIKPVILNLLRTVDAYALERLMISRIAPGKGILPHSDNVGAYVHLGDIARYHVVLRGFPGSVFKCGDEAVNMLTGEVWWFNAHLEHEVINNSAEDRIHLMADVRFWPGAKP